MNGSPQHPQIRNHFKTKEKPRIIKKQTLICPLIFEHLIQDEHKEGE
ncbi:hypothetical protein BAMY6639_13600 [Bacillus amyloliquefaciens UMAF6639]|nr:hypothetical protein BAMY6639_13600 [Bacillus amyloliquefaciens UMAF6639]